MTTHTVRYTNACAAIKLSVGSGYVDLREDDFDFITSDTSWPLQERARVRRCVESLVYGSLDVIGLPRFAAPAEFIAGVIAYFIHPVNLMPACQVMDGCQFTDNIISGIDAPVSASHLFAMVVQLHSGTDSLLERKFEAIQRSNSQIA